MADSHVHEHGARIERIQQPVEIVQELPVLMEVPELGKLQVCDPQGLTRDLREIVAKTGALHLDALLTGQHVAGVCVEFSRNGRQRDAAAICSRTCRKAGGCCSLKREILASQRCGGYCQTGMGSQRVEKRLREVSWRQWPERATGNCENG